MEIERKYLVSGAPPEGRQIPVQLVQGYVAIDSETEVRVRVAGEAAFLAVKTFRKPGSISRHELEYPIPLRDAGEMLAACCAGRIVLKRRRVVEHAGMAWEIDEYSGANEGLIVAEVELASETQRVELPSWVGAEITHDVRYSNRNLAIRPVSTWAAAGDPAGR